MITHDGGRIPVDPVPWDSDNVEWISIVWDQQVAIRGAIQSSEWILPEGWTAEETREDVPVETESGTQYSHATQVLLSGDATAGVTITNRVAFADGTQLDRSVQLRVQPT